MDVQTFITDIDYHITDADYYKSYTPEQKHALLTKLFKSLEDGQGSAYVITDGEQYLGEYEFPYRKIDFSNIHEFKRILEKVHYIIDPDQYRHLLSLIEKAEMDEIKHFSYQFNFEVDPRELRDQLEKPTGERIVTDFIFYYGALKLPEVKFNFKQKDNTN